MVIFFNDTATTEIYTLSLHDALPILKPAVPYDSSDLPGATAKNGHHCAVVSDPIDFDLRAPDHEVDVDEALVDPGLVGGIVDRVVVAVPECDVRRCVLVDERIQEDRLERPDSSLVVDEGDLAETPGAVVSRSDCAERIGPLVGVDLDRAATLELHSDTADHR